MAKNVIAELEEEQRQELANKRAVPDFAPGDTLRVSVFVREGERVRTQAFEGVCIARSGGETLNGGFTVRKISYNEGVERVFPLYSPAIESITVVRRGRVRRAKLYYLRDRRGKSARIVEKTNYKPRVGPGEEAAAKRAEEAKAKAAADKEAAAAAKAAEAQAAAAEAEASAQEAPAED